MATSPVKASREKRRSQGQSSSSTGAVLESDVITAFFQVDLPGRNADAVPEEARPGRGVEPCFAGRQGLGIRFFEIVERGKNASFSGEADPAFVRRPEIRLLKKVGGCGDRGISDTRALIDQERDFLSACRAHPAGLREGHQGEDDRGPRGQGSRAARAPQRGERFAVRPPDDGQQKKQPQALRAKDVRD